MEEALRLANYLPLSFKTSSEQDYIAFLWGAFETNCTYGKYQFAFLAYHMLMMSFVYFNVWQIKQYLKDDFQKATIGFGARDLEGLVHKDDADDKKRWLVSPFNFSKVQERAIVRILALIGCGKSKTGKYVSLVDDRNESVHSNGNILFSTQVALDTKITEVLRVVTEIENHSKPVIELCYRNFLLQNRDPEEREYPDTEDQIREILIHNNYLSREDIGICLSFDLANITERPEIDSIRVLHEELIAGYATD